MALTLGNIAADLVAGMPDDKALLQAEQLSRRALAISEKALGRDHPGLSGILITLALAMDKQNRPDEAQQFRQRALVSRVSSPRQQADAQPTIR